ncbi:Uroporphyrinogen-III synthase [Piscirickettsia salmonis]|uniref:uroporphyrinogen-III synthase n=1 Tax=Piscirickettsia salmonis TaxID=1238 RepID=UPI0012B7EC54|nr:uroporphyrinogen-III synthase [Piscirickettsia salmonis]QGP48718.1 Uroporphyrinogen-III synthase [Piscirickettsia salmonis]
MSRGPYLPLAGLSIAITRPPQYGVELQQYLTDFGAAVMMAPTLKLVSQPIAVSVGEQLKSVDCIVFISQFAVHAFFEQLNNIGPFSKLDKQYFAIGEKTAQVLEKYGITADYPVIVANSEALLDLPALRPAEITGKSVLIVRGGCGREYLAEQLRARGSAVHYLDVYRRQCPYNLPSAFIDAVAQQCIDVVIVTSVVSMLNLYQLLSQYDLQDRLVTFKLCVTSSRIGQIVLARNLVSQGQLIVAKSAEPREIARVLGAGEIM